MLGLGWLGEGAYSTSSTERQQKSVSLCGRALPPWVSPGFKLAVGRSVGWISEPAEESSCTHTLARVFIILTYFLPRLSKYCWHADLVFLVASALSLDPANPSLLTRRERMITCGIEMAGLRRGDFNYLHHLVTEKSTPSPVAYY